MKDLLLNLNTIAASKLRQSDKVITRGNLPIESFVECHSVLQKSISINTIDFVSTSTFTLNIFTSPQLSHNTISCLPKKRNRSQNGRNTYSLPTAIKKLFPSLGKRPRVNHKFY